MTGNIESPELIAAAVRRRAAVVGAFDPIRLLEEVAPGHRDEPIEDRIFSALATSIEEVRGAKEMLWRLQPEARRQALHELVARNELDRTIALTKPQQGDRFGEILQATLRTGVACNDASMQKMSQDELMLQALALDFARSLPVRKNAAKQKPAIDPRVLLARQAERQRQDHVAPKLFGRDRDAAALDGYIIDGSVVDPLHPLHPATNEPSRSRPLLMTGIGGSGKSALVADLMRRTQGDDWSGPIVVCLDFDQANVALGGEREWLNELTRQIGFARPALDTALSKIRNEARHHLHRLIQQREDVDRLTGTDTLYVVSTMRDSLQKVLGDGALASQTLVIIVDTFEEMVVRSNMGAENISHEPFGLVLAFIDSLTKFMSPKGVPVFGAIRAIVAGRAHPFPDQESLLANWFGAHLEVGELELDAATEFLRASGNRRIFTRARAERIVGMVPRFPLVLKLLVVFAREHDAHEIDEVINAAHGAGILGAAAFTRVLYSRFLERLKDHEIKDADGERLVPSADLVRLAHPGLALTIVTARLIREVLAEPTGLGEIDDQRAQDLFNALSREVWLVERVGANAVRHMPVLRRIMLPMLNGDLTPSENVDTAMRETVQAVHRAAAAWYRSDGADEPSAVVLAAYHDAFLGELAGLTSDPSLLRSVINIAGEDIWAMPTEARAVLRREAGTEAALSVEEAAALPVEERGKAAAIRQSRRVKAGVTSRQLDVEDELQDSPPRVEGSDNLGSRSPPSEPTPVKTRRRRRDQNEVLQDNELAQRIEASFAEADFEEVLRHGGQAAGELCESPQEEPPLDQVGDTTSHWTWKWALSCLATGAGDETSLKWAVAAPMPNNALRTNTPFRVGTVLSLAIATVALGGPPSFCASQPYREAITAYPVIEGTSATSILALRLRVLANYWDDRRPLKTPRTFEVRPELLQLVGLWEHVRNGSSAISIPEKLRDRLKTFERNPPLSSDLRLLDEGGDAVLVRASGSSWPRPSELPRSTRSAIGLLLRGRSPELYDPIRAALGDVAAADPNIFTDAVSQIEDLAPFWPRDLKSDRLYENLINLREADYLLARLVVFTDLADLTSVLFSTIERLTKTGRRFQAVTKLVQAYDRLLLAPYGAVDLPMVAPLTGDVPQSGSSDGGAQS